MNLKTARRPRPGAHSKPKSEYYSVPRHKRYAKGIELLLPPKSHAQLAKLTEKLKTRSRSQTVIHLLEHASSEADTHEPILETLRTFLESHGCADDVASEAILGFLNGACEHTFLSDTDGTCELCGSEPS